MIHHYRYNESPELDASGQAVRNAKWDSAHPHVGPCYAVRNRGSKTWFSIDGKDWFLSAPTGRIAINPPCIIRMHNGPLAGKFSRIAGGLRYIAER